MAASLCRIPRRFRPRRRGFDAGAWADLFAEAGRNMRSSSPSTMTATACGRCPIRTVRAGTRPATSWANSLARSGPGLTFGTLLPFRRARLDLPPRAHRHVRRSMACVPFEDDYRPALAQYRELIERYDADVPWNDIAYPDAEDTRPAVRALPRDPARGVVNDRWMASRGLRAPAPGPRAGVDAMIKGPPRRRPRRPDAARRRHRPHRRRNIPTASEFGERAWKPAAAWTCRSASTPGRGRRIICRRTNSSPPCRDRRPWRQSAAQHGPRADGSVPEVQQERWAGAGRLAARQRRGDLRHAAHASGDRRRQRRHAPPHDRIRTARSTSSSWPSPKASSLVLPTSPGLSSVVRLDGGGCAI